MLEDITKKASFTKGKAMSNFAVIEDGIVTNVIVAETKEIAEEATGKMCVESVEGNYAYIGLGYDSTTGIFEGNKKEVLPEEEEVPTKPIK